MKNILISLAIIAVIGGGIFLTQKKSGTSSSSTPASQTSDQGQTEGAEATSSPSKSMTASDVATHSTESDCYTIISDNVYNVTDLISEHPGGKEAILSVCGKDGTQTFETRGGRGPHPQRAQDELGEYLVAPLAK